MQAAQPPVGSHACVTRQYQSVFNGRPHSFMNIPHTESTLSFADSRFAASLFGPQNLHLETLAKLSGLHIASRGNTLTLKGEAAGIARVENILHQLYALACKGGILSEEDILTSYRLIASDPGTDLQKILQTSTFLVSPRKSIAPKTANQRLYIEALQSCSLSVAVGPAGTGKTYLAVAMALSLLYAKKVKRLILTRPAVEAGEKLGFLPGDMAQKVNPYLRPLFDALHDMLDFERVNEMIETGIIEIAPLAFMRGRTLNDSFIILDEGQNTTVEQMKMFVTRLGFGSRMVVTGDITQIDLPEGRNAPRSGLVHALEVLKDIDDISIISFEDKDVIRHPLVGRIVHAYDSFQKHTR